jgi:serine/threonine protein kinase
LGCVAYELAEGFPPYAELDIVRATIAISETRDKIILQEPSQWSDEFIDFIDRCLEYDVDSRATVSELLAHPFLQNNAVDRELLVSHLTTL